MQLFNYTLLVLSILFTTTLSAQDVYDKIAEQTCNCINEDDTAYKSSEELELALGLCMLEAMSNFPEETKDIDITDNDAMYKFGETVGIKMFSYCPDLILRLSQEELNMQEEEIEEEYYLVKGEITTIQGEEIQYVTIQEYETKKRIKLMWWHNFPNAYKLEDLGEQAIGQKVAIEYVQVETYSPQLKEYIIRKQITNIEILD